MDVLTPQVFSLEHSSLLLTTPQFPAHQQRLSSGLTVIHQQITATPVVVVDVWVRAGAVVEPAAWTGMAHFLEHMIFKGTDRLQPGDFDQLVESRGGATNAATSYDYAHYFIHTTAAHLSTMLPALADLLLHANIPDNEFDRERSVVLEEIRQADDDPDYLAFQALVKGVYAEHPYGRSVLGDTVTLQARLPQEMRQFHRAYYQPENMTVVVVGDVDCGTALALVEEAFSDFPARSQCLPAAQITEPSITGIQRQTLRLPRLEQARLLMAWTGPGVEQLRSAYGLDLLSVLLASGRSSRLVRELREEQQLVQAITSGFSLQREASLFTITAWLHPDDLERVEARIVDRLTDLLCAPIPVAELRRYQRLLRSDYAFSTESASQIAGVYGYYSTIAEAELATVYPSIVQSFEPDELQALANHYLSPDRYAVTAVRPA